MVQDWLKWLKDCTYVRFISLLQSTEEWFTVLRIPIPRRSPMLECMLETKSQLLMPATEIYHGRTFLLTTALILELKYRRIRRLEQLTVGVHSSVSVLIWLFIHFTRVISGPVCWLSLEMGQSFLPFFYLIRPAKLRILA